MTSKEARQTARVSSARGPERRGIGALFLLLVLTSCASHKEHLRSNTLDLFVVTSVSEDRTVRSLARAQEVLANRGVWVTYRNITWQDELPEFFCDEQHLRAMRESVGHDWPVLFLKDPWWAYGAWLVPMIRGCSLPQENVSFAILGWDSKFNGNIIAHELLHMMGSPHYWDDPLMFPEITGIMMGE